MNRTAITSVGLGLAVVVSLTAVVEAQHRQGHSTAREGSSAGLPPDDRAALGLSQSAEAGLKLTMREHLETIRDIVAALGRQDFAQAAKVSHEELGFPKHHRAMEREGGATFPPKYHELAVAHHQEAEDLAK
jgi:hypothetical protein